MDGPGSSTRRGNRWISILAVVVLGVVVIYGGRSRLPPEWNPWSPLAIDHPYTALTRLKLDRLRQDPVRCRAILETSAFEFEWLEDRKTAEACGFFNAVLIRSTAAEVSEPFSLSCPAALSLALWERHVAEPAAQELLGSGIARLEHFGSYSCRSIYGSGRISEHATANALDLAGVELKDGRRIRIVNHWSDPGVDGQFLRRLRDGACRYFNAVLGPEYNEAHRDHFHMDRGPARICR